MMTKTGNLIHIGDCVVAEFKLLVDDFSETGLFNSESFRSSLSKLIETEISLAPDDPHWVDKETHKEFFVNGVSVLTSRDLRKLSEVSWISKASGMLEVMKVSKSEVDELARRLSGL